MNELYIYDTIFGELCGLRRVVVFLNWGCIVMQFSKINSFPELGTEIFLPFYLAAIGFNECEGDIKRDEGYCTHLILYALSGKGELIVNGEKHILEADSSFVLRKNVPHEYRPLTEDWDTHWVSFDGFACDKMLDVMHIGDYAVYHNMNLEALNKIFRKMYLYSTERNGQGHYDTSVMVYEFLIEYNRMINRSGEIMEVECQNDSVLAAKRFIEQYYFKNITLNDIANYAYVSPQHLCRLFKEYVRKTPKQYLQEIRIKIAKFQLVNTTKPIAQIAADTGFESAYYFSVIFKKLEHMTPSEYRSNYSDM